MAAVACSVAFGLAAALAAWSLHRDAVTLWRRLW
jgi:hypothetical protein